MKRPSGMKRTPAGCMKRALRLMKHDAGREGGLIFRHVSQLTLETDQELPWSLDGEYAESVPLVEIRNHNRALELLL